MGAPRLRAFRGRAIYRALTLIAFFGQRLPLRLAQRFGRALGSLAFHVARRERRKALANLAIAFPDWSDAQRLSTTKEMFQHLGMCVFELVWLPNLDAQKRLELTELEGLDRVLEIIDSGRGVVVFTAHCGNWEWLSYVTGMAGRPVSVLQRERDQPEMNRFITELRAKGGVRTIDRGSTASARDMIQAIKRGGILAFVLDQNIRTESVKVPFFGKPALTPIGPAELAMRTNAVAVTAVIERLPNGHHRARFLEPFECSRDGDAVALTARITREIEDQIRRVPAQWVWMHDRWRDRPKWDVSA